MLSFEEDIKTKRRQRGRRRTQRSKDRCEKVEEDERKNERVGSTLCSRKQLQLITDVKALASSHHLVLLLHLGDLFAVHLVDLFELRQHSFAALSQHLFIADQLISGETTRVRQRRRGRKVPAWSTPTWSMNDRWPKMVVSYCSFCSFSSLSSLTVSSVCWA